MLIRIKNPLIFILIIKLLLSIFINFIKFRLKSAFIFNYYDSAFVNITYQTYVM